MKHQKSNSTLVITSRDDEGILINGDIKMYIVHKRYKGRWVIRTYIQAPKDVPIARFKIPDGVNPFDAEAELPDARNPDAARDKVQNQGPKTIGKNRRFVVRENPTGGNSGNT